MIAWVVGSLLGAAVAPLDAAQIFRSARAYLTAIDVPAYVVCTMQDATFVEYDGRRAPIEERFRVAIRTSDGHAFVQTQRLQHGYEGRLTPVVVGDNAIFPNTGFYRLDDLPTSTFSLRPADPAPEVRPESRAGRRVLRDVFGPLRHRRSNGATAGIRFVLVALKGRATGGGHASPVASVPRSASRRASATPKSASLRSDRCSGEG